MKLEDFIYQNILYIEHLYNKNLLTLNDIIVLFSSDSHDVLCNYKYKFFHLLDGDEYNALSEIKMDYSLEETIKTIGNFTMEIIRDLYNSNIHISDQEMYILIYCIQKTFNNITVKYREEDEPCLHLKN